ncbi:fumarylacetoacetate hydrolase family protein [Mesorhizobium qingshengii]
MPVRKENVMRFVRFAEKGEEGLAIEEHGVLHGLLATDRNFPGTLDSLVSDSEAIADAAVKLRAGKRITAAIDYLAPFTASKKIICVGLNYRDHSAESGYAQPPYPTVFGRFTSSLIGHKTAMVRPQLSNTLDYEGELVAVIGKGGSKIAEQDALDHVAGYSIFNDGSIREFQHITPQWTIGKNFDSTGAFGPAFVTADELPAGCLGLTLETRLNGQVVQHAKIDDMVFSVAELVALMSRTMTLEPGDMIVTGTPSGVGAARKPQLFMKPGDICEVEIEKLGVLVNTVVDETADAQAAA